MKINTSFSIFAERYLVEFHEALALLSVPTLERIYRLIEKVRTGGKKLIVVGNGGSAANAMHYVCDFSKGTAVKGHKRLRSMSLASETAIVTAYANDFSYEDIFSEQMETHVDRGDLVFVMSASGNSPNVVKAVRAAKRRGATVAGIFGFGGGKLKSLVDVSIVIPHKNYGQAEDVQTVIMHIISQYMRLTLESSRSQKGKKGQPFDSAQGKRGQKGRRPKNYR